MTDTDLMKAKTEMFQALTGLLKALTGLAESAKREVDADAGKTGKK